MNVATSTACTRYVLPLKYPDLCQGLATFPTVFAGYYRVRAFSDYGVPINSTVTNTATGAPETEVMDLGVTSTYSSYDSLLLPRVPTCDPTYGKRDDWSGHGVGVTQTAVDMWKVCTEKFVDGALDLLEKPSDSLEQPREYDRFKASFLVTPTVRVESEVTTTSTSTSPIDVNLGFLRKRTESAVVSRFIDIIDPCKEMRTNSFLVNAVTTIGSLVSSTAGGGPWTTGCMTAPGGLTATLAGTGTGAQIGVATASYPFNITQPNFGARVSLNFAYNLVNSYIVVTVQMGTESAIGLVTPNGIYYIPPGGTGIGIDLRGVPALGGASGKANFEFAISPKGAGTGKVILTFVPASTIKASTGQADTVLASAAIEDDAENNKTMFLRVSTFEVTAWPAVNFPNRGNAEKNRMPCSDTGHPNNDCGHLFGFRSNYSAWTGDSTAWTGGQIKPGYCRDISNTASKKARVCEDWDVIVHSPKAPAADAAYIGTSLMDIVDSKNRDPGEYVSIVDEFHEKGGRLYTPLLPRIWGARIKPFFDGTVSAAETSALSSGIRTNGSHFELLRFPRSLLETHPKEIEICINDGTQRTTSNCLGDFNSEGDWVGTTHTVNTVEKVTSTPYPTLSPFVPYVSGATSYYWPD